MSEKSSAFCCCFKTKGETKDLIYTKRPRAYDEVQIEEGKTEMTDNKEGLMEENLNSADRGIQIQGKVQGVQ